MGCTQSTQVVEAKKKNDSQLQVTSKIIPQEEPKLDKISKEIPERGDCFLIGSLNEKQQVFGHIKLETMSINKMSIPNGGFICNNFSSMLELQKGQYFISGGINYDLTQISDKCFYYFSNEHRVQPLSPMIQARYTHSTLHLPQKNSIYIIGGRHYGDDSQAILSQCEKYDIEDGKCFKLPEMNVKRCTCFVFTWKNTIYTFGGYTGPFQRSTLIEYLDTDQKQWKVLDVQLNRGLEGAILLPTDDNQITIFGGLSNSGPTDSVVTINLQEKSIRSKRKLAEKRSLYKSFYKKGSVYFFGGDDNFTCEVYNIAKQTSQITKKQFGFSIQQFDCLGFSASSVHVPYKQKTQVLQSSNLSQESQIIYIVGTTEEPFLCELNISIPTARFINVPLNLKLYAHQAGVFLNPNQVIFFGGIEDDSLSVISADTFLYNINKKMAKNIARMNQNRYAFAYQWFQNSKKQVDMIYCFGGGTADSQGKLVLLNTCEKFTVKTKKWQLMAPCPQKLISPMILTFKEDIFLFGGTNQQNRKSKSIYLYSPKSDNWCQLQTKMMFGIEAASITRVSQNQFYIFGGLLENGPSQTIWSIYLKQSISHKKNQTLCLFQEKGKMNEKKVQHKAYKPKGQDFYVIFGGQNPLTFYKSNLELETSDSLLNLKLMFMDLLDHLNSKDLKPYLIAAKNIG